MPISPLLILYYSELPVQQYGKKKRANKKGWDKSPSLSIFFALSSKTQWLSGLYYADLISFYSPTQLCGGGTTKSNSNELPISVPLSFLWVYTLSFEVELVPESLLVEESLFEVLLPLRVSAPSAEYSFTKISLRNSRKLSSLRM